MLEEKGFRGGGLNSEEANGQEQKPVRVLFVSDSRFWGFSRLSLSLRFYALVPSTVENIGRFAVFF